MLNKLIVSAAALAAFGFAGAASAGDTTTVNIEVAKVFDFAVKDATINLTLDGANAENSAGAASAISYNSNMEVDLSADVTGTWPAVTTVAGDELFLHIFGDTADVTASMAALVSNASTPAGAASWSVTNDGATQLISSNLAIQPVWGEHFDMVYVASAQNEMPPPSTYSLTVTYTFVES